MNLDSHSQFQVRKPEARRLPILLIGATGFIGSALLAHLSRMLPDVPLRVPSRRAWRHQALSTMPQVQLIQADVHNDETLGRLIENSALVVNLAGILHGDVGSPWGKAFERVHVQLPMRILRALDHQALIHISALACQPQAVDTAPSMYLRSKSQAEKLLLQSGHPVSLVRPSVVFGPGDQFLNVFARLGRLTPVVPLAGAHARFAPVHVQDLGQAISTLVLHRLDRLGSQRPEGLSQLGLEEAIVVEAFGPDSLNLAALFRFACHAAQGSSPWIIPLPYSLAYLQALMLQALPGPPLMSVDNLHSMRIDNLPSGRSEVLGVSIKTLEEIGVSPRSLESARAYLRRP